MFTKEIEETADGTLIRAIHDVEVDWSDQVGWFDPNKIDSVATLIGAGGIGSNVAFELITMGFRRFVLYDHDTVERRNLASQKAYRHTDFNHSKVEALADVLLEYGATEVLIRDRWFTAEDIIEGPVVIGGVDSMSARKIIWEAVLNSPAVELYLDGRLNGETAQIFAIDVGSFDTEWYEDWLFPDENGAKNGDCTKRMIVYPATALAATMCRHLSRWYRGLPICHFVEINLENLKVLKVGDIETSA